MLFLDLFKCTSTPEGMSCSLPANASQSSLASFSLLFGQEVWLYQGTISVNKSKRGVTEKMQAVKPTRLAKRLKIAKELKGRLKEEKILRVNHPGSLFHVQTVK